MDTIKIFIFSYLSTFIFKKFLPRSLPINCTISGNWTFEVNVRNQSYSRIAFVTGMKKSDFSLVTKSDIRATP